MKTLRNLFTALLLLVATVASAQDFEVDGIYYCVTNDVTNTVEVRGGNQSSGNLVIPESVTYNDVTYSVTSIGGWVFNGRTDLTGELVIPNSVTSIGDYAFYGCSGLTSVVIGNSVTSIGWSAFSGCSGLTGNLVIPAGVTTIGSSAFSGCSALTGTLVIPNSVTKIGGEAFYGCSGLTGELVIPAGVTTIGSLAFSRCSGLSSVTIPNSVTSIGDNAFYDCDGLKEVYISDLSAWCRIDFSGWYANPLSCANNLYLNGDLVTELVIPDDVLEIKQIAFRGCSGLTSVTIGNSVTSIGVNAFDCCSGLTSVTIGNSVTSIGGSAFACCSGLSSVTIPNSVTSIGGDAFILCTGLTSVTIGNSVTSIGDNAFNECYGLKEVYISDLGAWCNIDFGGITANPMNYAKNLYLNNELVTEVVVPDGVTSIKKYAFYNCDKITNVVIPSSVTSIGDNAFNAAKAVFDIAAETPATLGGSSTFAGNAVFVVPSASVDVYKTAWNSYATQIAGKDDAFVSVDVKAKESTSGIMEKLGLDKVGSVTKLTVKGSINSYDVIQFRDKMPLLRELDLTDATVVASDKAFYSGSCTGDNSLGDNTFRGLSNLNLVKLPRGLNRIGSCMFQDCGNLKSIENSDVVTSIGYSAFSGCGNLEHLTLPDGLEAIEGWTFANCHSLKEIKLPPTVKRIGEYAFYNCGALEEMRIPSSVETVGDYAFWECNNLQSVYTYTVEPTSIKEETFSTFATATLYVPSFSLSNYYWDDGWKRFLNLAEFNEPYEYFYVNNDYVLDDDTGYIEGTEGNAPDADINAGGGFIVEGEQGDDEAPNQSLGDVNVGSDGEGNSGSIIGDNNLHIDDLHIKINVKGGRWYFFAFPFDIWFDNISMENGSDYVFRYYDGEERATNGNGGWKDINENHLKAARGYIFQCSADDVLVLSIEDVKFKKEDKYNELVAHASENLNDASWNFVGNPYLCYYDVADMDYTAPVTVWNGEMYEAIRPGDDDYHFAPYEAFFVQKPENQDGITYDGEMQMTKNQSEKEKEKQSAARRARGINPDRLLINLVLDNGTSSDRTRIVFNNQQSLGYETACDASKFETKGVVQLYTIGGDKVRYAINERPADNGVVMLGYTAPTAGFYTIEAQRMDAEVFVKDYKTGELHNLNDGAYSFSTDAGTFNERFEILLKGTAPGTTGIEDVNGENGNVKTVYDLQGRKMKDAGKGIYIIDGEKVVK